MLRSLVTRWREIARRLVRDAPPRYFATALALLVAPLLVAPWMADSASPDDWVRMDSWPGGRKVVEIACADSDPRFVYALSSSSGLHASFDAGLHWQRAEIPAQSKLFGLSHAIDIAVCPEIPANVYLLLESLSGAPRPMIYQSSDAGATWRAESGLGPTRVRAMTFGERCDDLILVTLADIYQAFGERDGQRIFVPDLSALEDARLASIDPISRVSDLVAVSWPDGEGQIRRHIYAATPDAGVQAYVDASNGAMTPVSVADDPLSQSVRGSAAVHAVCVAPSRPGLVCIGTDSGMFASMDAGETWFPTAYALRHERVLSLLMDESHSVIYAGLAGGGVYRSADNGATWEPVGRGLDHQSVHSLAMANREIAGSVILAGTSDGIWQYDLLDVGEVMP